MSHDRKKASPQGESRELAKVPCSRVPGRVWTQATRLRDAPHNHSATCRFKQMIYLQNNIYIETVYIDSLTGIDFRIQHTVWTKTVPQEQGTWGTRAAYSTQI